MVSKAVNNQPKAKPLSSKITDPNTSKKESFYLFDHKEDGIYFNDENTKDFRICSPLEIVAETQTETGENYGRLLEWKDSQERLHRWAMPIEFVHSDGSELAKYLASNGLEIIPSRKAREKLAFYIATEKAKKVCISTPKIGWNDGRFVLPGKTIGESDSRNEIVYQTEYDGHHSFNSSGTPEEWQNEISKYCKGNSRLLFAVAAAFSAPLLPIVQTQGGGFHFRGSTSTGKTTASLVGGSVWGGDSENGFLQPWKATANGLEIVAAGHNHALLCLDEIGECDSREIGNVAYMLANGRGKIRMTKTLQARHSLSWNLLFLSTGEQSLADKIRESGGTIKGGQEIRFCDIEADTGVFGLFESLNGFPSGQAFSDHLRNAAVNYYGTAIEQFLEHLVKQNHSEIRTDWHKFKDAFIDQIIPNKEGVPGEVFRVAARFALVAFGGELATEAGITKWEIDEAVEAAKIIFMQWMNGREGSGQSDIERGIQQVADFLNSNEIQFQNLNLISETETDKYQKVKDLFGYIRTGKLDEKEYLIFVSKFRKDVCKGFNYKSIESILREKHCIDPQDEITATKNIKINGTGKRYYVITQNIFAVADEAENIKSEKAKSMQNAL